jgi:hypothetical protein
MTTYIEELTRLRELKSFYEGLKTQHNSHYAVAAYEECMKLIEAQAKMIEIAQTELTTINLKIGVQNLEDAIKVAENTLNHISNTREV